MDKIPMTAAGYTVPGEGAQAPPADRAAPRIIQQITDARSHGDLSENAEYHAAKEQQSHNEGRIAELEDKLARAEVIDVSKLSGDTVKFGATVTPDRRGHRQEGGLADRRRAGGGCQGGAHLDHLTARPRPRRQEEGRQCRGRHARRRQSLRGREGRVALRPARATCVVAGPLRPQRMRKRPEFGEG